MAAIWAASPDVFPAPLPPILTLARSGATSRAWDAFVAAGLDGVLEVDALTLKGRLLKDRAKQAAGAERAALFAQSGAAYAHAATLRPDSYPLINAAAMALFAGDGASAASIARDVLTLVDGDRSRRRDPLLARSHTRRSIAVARSCRSGAGQFSNRHRLRAASL